MSEITTEHLAHMGCDLFVANVARVSFAKWSDTFTTREMMKKGSDEGIIEYLAKHNHWTPFGHPTISVRVKAPVPIRTQCFKSKIGFVENEESRRYISTTPEVFIPDSFRLKPSGSAKQGSAGEHPSNEFWLGRYRDSTAAAVSMYEMMIEDGVAPEQARFVLPQGCMVNWIWTGSLQAFARFCKLRKDPHAQLEVKVVADQLDEIILSLFPYSWKALMNN